MSARITHHEMRLEPDKVMLELRELSGEVRNLPEYYGYSSNLDRLPDSLTFRLKKLPSYGLSATIPLVELVSWKISRGDMSHFVGGKFREGHELNPQSYTWTMIADSFLESYRAY
jgi:hypothetical protein